MRLCGNEVNTGLVVAEWDLLPGDLLPVVLLLDGDQRKNIDTQSSQIFYVCSITLVTYMFLSINHLTNHLSTDKDLFFSLPAYVHVCIEQV